MRSRRPRKQNVPTALTIGALAGLVVAVLALGAFGVAACSRASSKSATGPKPSAMKSATGASATATSKPATSAPATAAVIAAAPVVPTKRKSYGRPLPKPIAKITPPKKAGTLTGPRNLPVPMLMYHAIDIMPVNAPFPDLWVSPKAFAAQLNYLTTHGYHAVTMQQVYDFWHGKGTLPTKPIVLTFDDGFTGDFETAAPLLKSIKWPATLFLIVGKKQPRMLSTMVTAMIDSGWELGSHTITHEELPTETPAKMKDDIARSRKLLSKQYGVPVNFFCYPSGKFNAQAVADVEDAGYLLATTTIDGLAKPSQPFLLRRIRVAGGASLQAFAASLER